MTCPNKHNTLISADACPFCAVEKLVAIEGIMEQVLDKKGEK